MRYTMHALRRGADGVIHRGPDMLPDYLNGGRSPETWDDMADMLINDEYDEVVGDPDWCGWGAVYRHRETGELVEVRAAA